MSDKLQQLTDRLYEEGLSKGREEGERILAKAREDADKILKDAAFEAEAIIAKAGAEAAELRSKSESDVRMASRKALQETRSDIENMLLDCICGKSVNQALGDPDFLKKMILEVCRNFSATCSKDIRLVLPDALKDQLESWTGGELKKLLDRGVDAGFSGKLTGGFRIAPSDGGWFINLDDETFRELISGYLRPLTRKLLFGE